MKGVNVKQLRTFVSAILDQLSRLLQTEPARLIGYGSAVVVFLVAKVLADRGYVQFNLTFEESVLTTAAALTLVAGVIESIRRFVYSPQTYIEDLADEFRAGHEEAHFEEAMRAAYADALAELEREAAPKRTRSVSIGTAKADGASDKAN